MQCGTWSICTGVMGYFTALSLDLLIGNLLGLFAVTLGWHFEDFSLGFTFSVEGVTIKSSAHAPTSLSEGSLLFWAWIWASSWFWVRPWSWDWGWFWVGPCCWHLFLISFNVSKLSTTFCKLLALGRSMMYKGITTFFFIFPQWLAELTQSESVVSGHLWFSLPGGCHLNPGNLGNCTPFSWLKTSHPWTNLYFDTCQY